MAQETINIGSAANDGSGSPLRTAFEICNNNFSQLFGSEGFIVVPTGTSDPDTTTVGAVYYNTNTNNWRIYVSGAWQNA